jgi:hypothetical protein
MEKFLIQLNNLLLECNLSSVREFQLPHRVFAFK